MKTLAIVWPGYTAAWCVASGVEPALFWLSWATSAMSDRGFEKVEKHLSVSCSGHYQQLWTITGACIHRACPFCFKISLRDCLRSPGLLTYGDTCQGNSSLAKHALFSRRHISTGLSLWPGMTRICSSSLHSIQVTQRAVPRASGQSSENK